MVVSLIFGIGSLSKDDAELIAAKGATILVFFWVIGLIVIYVFSLALPVIQRSSFFSESEITTVKTNAV